MKKTENYSRWPEWVSGVLTKMKNPERLQKVIASRQRDIDDDQDEADLIADCIRKRLLDFKHDPSTCHVMIPVDVIADWIAEFKSEKISPTKITPYLRRLGIANLCYKRNKKGVRWIWRGTKCKDTTESIDLADSFCRRRART